MTASIPIAGIKPTQASNNSAILSYGSSHGNSTSPILYRSTSQSLPALSSQGTLNRMKESRRASGDTEFAFYERVSGLGYSSEEDYDESSDGLDMEMEEEAPQSASAKAKGKGKAMPVRSREERAKKRKEERRASLNARRPVITLRKDSGWQFSQSALFPQHMRDAYSLCNPTNPSRKPNQSIYGHQGDQDDSESEDHHAVQVTEIRIGPEDELS